MNTTHSCSRSEPKCTPLIPAPPPLVPPPSFLGDARVGDGRCISTLQDLFHAMDFSHKVEHEFEVQCCGICQSWGQGGRGCDGSGGQPAHKLQRDLVRD